MYSENLKKIEDVLAEKGFTVFRVNAMDIADVTSHKRLKDGRYTMVSIEIAIPTKK